MKHIVTLLCSAQCECVCFSESDFDSCCYFYCFFFPPFVRRVTLHAYAHVFATRIECWLDVIVFHLYVCGWSVCSCIGIGWSCVYMYAVYVCRYSKCYTWIVCLVNWVGICAFSRFLDFMVKFRISERFVLYVHLSVRHYLMGREGGVGLHYTR